MKNDKGTLEYQACHERYSYRTDVLDRAYNLIWGPASLSIGLPTYQTTFLYPKLWVVGICQCVKPVYTQTTSVGRKPRVEIYICGCCNAYIERFDVLAHKWHLTVSHASCALL